MSTSVPLYDRHGRAKAFLLDGKRIITLRGAPLAFFQSGSIYDYTGRHLGWWEGQFVRGRDGGVGLWMRGASTGLLMPLPSLPPLAPLPQLEPLRPLPQLPPLKPLPRRAWSEGPLT